MDPYPQPLLDALTRWPDRPAFEYEGREVARAEVYDTVRTFAAALRARGLGRCDGVAILTGVSPDAFAVQLAAHVLGCRVVAVRPGWTPRQLAHMLATDVAAVVVDTATPEVEEAAGAIPLHTLEDLRTHAPASTLETASRPDDIGWLFFTSGSTGNPKGCAYSYRALAAHWAYNPANWTPPVARLAAGYERLLLMGTLSSQVVMDYLTFCLATGGTAVIPDRTAPFEDAIERHRITGILCTVPRLYGLLDRVERDGLDVSTLKAVMVSGSPITPQRLHDATERLGPVVHQAYGQTEVCLVTLLTPDDLGAWPSPAAASVGRPHPLVETEVRAGELYVRSPYQMDGYWNDPEQTADALGQDGWMRTRDLADFDELGFLRLIGRARDIVIVNAIIHYAGAIEQTLASHPDVDQAYVVGAPDESTGEAIHAFVVPNAGRTPDLANLAKHVGEELGDASVPHTFTILDDVPVAPSGKPDKRALLGLLT
ncbi:class I adenylate-forming enzyme family protein [Tenggerimyces flavus]|uniref:Long-chain-fatty-acid--CoA ligase n=1 Tax=Tenggerimyces flavus TaxID=1708749 RepID=A0ABV7YEP1_9ACTN|nr:AMP-binding protein [Tenggerimyces flavus]MBM7787004.1 acyl-CoA synthetase (AMP-forming)/AMP-acid ligase II [Tenggerimyces flavus]